MLSTYAGGIPPSGGNDVSRIALGNKVIEHSLLGLPVLATDRPGIRAVFDDSCFFYRVEDPADFVRAARSLLSDDACAKRKALRSQELIDKRGLTWSRVEGRLVGMYRKLGEE